MSSAAPATYFPPEHAFAGLELASSVVVALDGGEVEARGSAHLLSLGEGKTLEHIFLLLVSLSKGALTFYPLLATSFH